MHKASHEKDTTERHQTVYKDISQEIQEQQAAQTVMDHCDTQNKFKDVSEDYPHHSTRHRCGYKMEINLSSEMDDTL